MTFQPESPYGRINITINPRIDDLRTIDVKVTYRHPQHMGCSYIKHAGKQHDFTSEDSETKTVCNFNVSLRDYNTATGIVEDVLLLIEPEFYQKQSGATI